MQIKPVFSSPGLRYQLDGHQAVTEKPSLPQEDLEKLPLKRERRWWRQLRHSMLAVYQRIFSLVFIANAIAFVVLLTADGNESGPPLSSVAGAASANLFVVVVARQEYFVNFIFFLARSMPRSAPLRLRRMMAKIYHYGGVHSGSAVACIMWFLLFTVLITIQWVKGDLRSIPVLSLTYILLIELILISALAIPPIRSRYHNTFENVHRLAGWSSLALFWVLIPLLANSLRIHTGNDSLGVFLVKSPAFWFLLASTLCIIRPWLDLRYIEAYPEYLSNHAVRITFKHIKNAPGAAIRISDAPLKEWHAFACIPGPDVNTCSIIVSDAGDWTRQQIAHPAQKYYIRGIPTAGVMSMAQVFNRVVMVATGSGIGPLLSILMVYDVPSRILWSTPSPLQTYGKKLMDEVTDADPNAVIIDTRISGRPDMVRLAYNLYIQTKAEAVFIISNPKLTGKMVYGLESRGVPAYGPIWDS